MVKVPLPLNASTKHKHKTQALMGATRLASGKMQCSYTISKGSQTALITLKSVNLCHKNPDAGRVAPISGSVWCLRLVVAFGGSVWCLRFVPYLLLTSSMRHPIK